MAVKKASKGPAVPPADEADTTTTADSQSPAAPAGNTSGVSADTLPHAVAGPALPPGDEPPPAPKGPKAKTAKARVRKRRYTKRAAPPKTEATEKPASTRKAAGPEATVGMLMIVHQGLAAMLKCPEFALEPNEAKRLGEVTQALAAEYGVTWSRKAELWGTLATVGLAVYAPRLLALKARRQAARQTSKSNGARPPEGLAVAAAAAAQPDGFRMNFGS